LYTGEIQRGVAVGERRIKRMSAPDHARAFERAEDISGFFMNGSEFLLHREWRDLVRQFARRRTMLSLATNGMLLDREASALLVESGVLRDINFSFDGASAEMVERVRPGVRHDVLLRNLGDFLDVLAASGKRLTVSLSMVLLNDNVHEAPSLVELAAAVRRDRGLAIHVSFQLLNPASDPDYARFAAAQRTDLSEARTKALLLEAAGRGDALGIPTRYSYRGSLRDALASA
jgi:molybdenum cofactor biosynthesis enzyme MoaA